VKARSSRARFRVRKGLEVPIVSFRLPSSKRFTKTPTARLAFP